jgi:Xaa-Pro aminopeptidase
LWQAALPQVEWVPASAQIDRLRLVLSDDERALVRAADAVADLGQELLIQHIAPGRRAFDLVQEVRAAMVAECCRLHPDKPFHLHVDPGLGAGTKAAGHSEWTLWNAEDRVGNPHLLTTVISVWLWGYWGNVERSVYMGAPTPEVRRAFDVMVEANETAIAAIRPGLRLADVDRTAKAVLARHGYPTRSGSGCGRGTVSYEGNARELRMDVRLYADVILEPGMAFSLEPDVHLPGVGTFRHCNTIMVTPDGCAVDSRLPRDPIYV